MLRISVITQAICCSAISIYVILREKAAEVKFDLSTRTLEILCAYVDETVSRRPFLINKPAYIDIKFIDTKLYVKFFAANIKHIWSWKFDL